jgi:uncharacterized OB-fold protein
MAARDAYRMAGITRPEAEIDVWEPYDPFDYKALHHMNGLLQDRTGAMVKRLLAEGAFTRDGTHPMCPSGGALGVGNPIAATGLMKIAELYFQLSGQAGARQVPKDVRRGIAQAWGDLMQVGTVVIMGGEGSSPLRSSAWRDMTRDDLPGTAIKSVSDVPSISFEPRLTYRWDDGYALTTYLDGFENGTIRASYCAGCDRMLIPSRSFCELCNLRSVDRYFDMPDTGIVETFTISHVDWSSAPLPDGEVVIFAVVAIDGAGPHMGLVHRLGDVDPSDVEIGMRVKAVWKPAPEREGKVTDLLYFRPAAEDEDEGEIVPVKPVELTRETAGSMPGKIPLDYAYTAGLGGGRFYADLAEGKLSATECPECRRALVPPSGFCELCLRTLGPGDVVELDPESGVVAAATLVFDDRYGHELDDPVWVVQVEFPDAAGSLFGRIDAAPGAVIGVGAPVRLEASSQVGPEHVRFSMI